MSLPAPPPGWSLGLDVWSGTGEIDAPLLIAESVAFLWARAMLGHTPDSRWEATAHACAGCGLPFGGYGVLVPGHDAEAQAAAFCAALEASPGWSLPPALDLERAEHETAAECLSAAARWVAAVEGRLRARVILYTGPAFFRGLERLSAGNPAASADVLAIARCPLWVADYLDGRLIDPSRNSARVPPPWERPTVWQVGPAGATLPGTHTPVDVDWLRGDVANLEALASPS